MYFSGQIKQEIGLSRYITCIDDYSICIPMWERGKTVVNIV